MSATLVVSACFRRRSFLRGSCVPSWVALRAAWPPGFYVSSGFSVVGPLFDGSAKEHHRGSHSFFDDSAKERRHGDVIKCLILDVFSMARPRSILQVFVFASGSFRFSFIKPFR